MSSSVELVPVVQSGDFNAEHLKFKRTSWWHFSGAALTIWVTRNWTTDPLMATVAAVERKRAGATCEGTFP